MTSHWLLWIPLAASIGTAAVQRADVTNAQVERRDAPIGQTIASLAGVADPVWIGWQVPMVSGLRDLCGAWSDGLTTVRGAILEDGVRPMPELGPDNARVAYLEAGTALAVWVRIVDGRVERLRFLSDDCPVDGGGRRLIRLEHVTPSDSVRFLDELLTPPPLSSDTHRRRATSIITGLALHADGSAAAVLDRYLTPTAEGALRAAAAMGLARFRGAAGFERLVAIARTSVDVDVRRASVAALAQTRQPATLDTLWQLAESDRDDHVRADALATIAALAPDTDVPRVLARLQTETSEAARQQAVRGLSRRPAGGAVPLLVNLARTSRDRTVRTEAVRALSRSTDPAALAYLADVLR